GDGFPIVPEQCAEMDARLDAMSIDFDEELYPHMLTAIAGRRWVIGHGLRLVTMKCVKSLEMRQAFADVVSAGIAKGMSEGLKHGVEHGHAQRTIESLEAYDPEAEAKFAAALQSLKDLKLPLLDQLEGLKDAPMDVIRASLYLEDDTGDDAPQFIRDLRPSSSQLAIPVYPEVRDPRNPWACTEEIKLADAIAANISRAEQKKRSRIVCRTHGVGSAHHAKLNLPLKQLLTEDFLSDEERRILESDGEIKVRLVRLNLKMFKEPIELKIWDMTWTSNLVLTSKWNQFVEENKDYLKELSMIQIWSFRKDQQLCFALVVIDRPPLHLMVSNGIA
nr:B3 domain-containing protein, DNA-binding pseudobarrel domain protein [Tanacetum cinerariifolium]